MPLDPQKLLDQASSRVIDKAIEVAARFDHVILKPEHVLVALLESDGIAVKVLEERVVRFAQILGPVTGELASSRWLTSGAQGVPPATSEGIQLLLEHAREEATALGDKFIGPEHLLMGIFKDHASVAARVLRAEGLTLENTRADVLKIRKSAGVTWVGGNAGDLAPMGAGAHLILDEMMPRMQPLRLLVDPGTAHPTEVAELLTELSTLYRMLGGSGITFVHSGTKSPEHAHGSA